MTPRQAEVLDYLAQYIHDEGISPAVRDVASALKVTPMTIQRHLDALEAGGYIRRVPRCPRTIRIVAQP